VPDCEPGTGGPLTRRWFYEQRSAASSLGAAWSGMM
jgi:hypothetical protein